MTLSLLLFRGGSPVAASSTPTGEVTRAPLYITAPHKRWTAPDLFPNLAILAVLVGAIPHPAPEPQITRRTTQQPDIFPNPALRLAAGLNIPALFEQPTPRRAQAPELSPNLAIATPVVIAIAPSPVDPTFTRRAPPQVDAYPNIAFSSAPAYSPPPALQDPQQTRRTQTPDLTPNIAVNLQTQVVKTSPEAVTLLRKTVAPDLYPNVAVNFQTLVTQQGPETTFTRKLAQAPELFPNLAALAPLAQIPLVMPIEPWVNKRYPPQVEVFQNQAINAPLAPQTFPAPIEPTFTIRIALAPEVFPNLAVEFDNPLPPAPIPSTDGHSIRETNHSFEARLFQELARQPENADSEDRGGYVPSTALVAFEKPDAASSIATPAPKLRRYDDEIMAVLWMLM